MSLYVKLKVNSDQALIIEWPVIPAQHLFKDVVQTGACNFNTLTITVRKAKLVNLLSCQQVELSSDIEFERAKMPVNITLCVHGSKFELALIRLDSEHGRVYFDDPINLSVAEDRMIPTDLQTLD